jgi:phenylalanine-4-hydroxylase
LNECDRVDFIKFSGPTQISFDDNELPNQGISHHPEGFSSPIGNVVGISEKDPANFTQTDLKKLGLVKGEQCVLDFVSGFKVEGNLVDIQYRNGNLILMKWRQCTVSRQDTIFFSPEWGDFDMVVGAEIPSVFGGAADQEKYGLGDVGQATTKPGRTSPYSDKEKHSFSLYARLRALREEVRSDSPDLEELQTQFNTLNELIDGAHESEWLLRLEALELANKIGVSTDDLNEGLVQYAKNADAEVAKLVQDGVALFRTN